MFFDCLEEHSRLWLAALAVLPELFDTCFRVMWAVVPVVEFEADKAGYLLLNSADSPLIEESLGNSGLI